MIATPPGVPAERLAALRAAFVATFKDKEFLDEAKKRDLVTDYVAGADLEAQFVRVLEVSAGVLQEGSGGLRVGRAERPACFDVCSPQEPGLGHS